jgi:hypothetical protein
METAVEDTQGITITESGGGTEIRKIIPTRNGHTYINVPYSQSEVILQEFKKLSFSTQTIAHFNQHILQKSAIKTNRTYQPLDGVSISYIICPR